VAAHRRACGGWLLLGQARQVAQVAAQVVLLLLDCARVQDLLHVKVVVVQVLVAIAALGASGGVDGRFLLWPWFGLV